MLSLYTRNLPLLIEERVTPGELRGGMACGNFLHRTLFLIMIVAVYNDLVNKHVLVTGGASGIGAAIVSAFLEQRANVSVLDVECPRRLDSGPEQRGRVVYEQCDLRDPAQIDASIAKVRSSLGAVEILVNNAARDERHAISEVDAERWDDLTALNLRAAFLVARAVSADMVKADAGNIVNISSNSFLLGLSGYATYVTAKAGLWGMTRALARELGVSEIRVNCLVPGWVATERQKREWMTPAALSECLEAQCLKQVIAPEDIAQACLFLASTASRMMTGQMLVVDGGRA